MSTQGRPNGEYQRAPPEGNPASVPLLAVRELVKHYRLPREKLLGPEPAVQALQGVSFDLHVGRSLGVVGESGSGKSTLARLVMALEPPTSGQVLLEGRDLYALDAPALRAARAKMQMVFQDPYGSLDPRRTVLHTVSEPLRMLERAGAAEQRERATEALQAVGLGADALAKYPHEFSGGQRQRIAIARALITRPRLIVADEPVSALDVSVQAQVLNLMLDLRQQFGLALLLISHDLAVVDMVCDDVIVLYQGRIAERGAPDTLFRRAAHPYTRALLQAVPRVAPGAPRARRASAAPGEGAPAIAGCAFAPRCVCAEARCRSERPSLRAVGGAAAHLSACHRAEAVTAAEGVDALTQNA